MRLRFALLVLSIGGLLLLGALSPISGRSAAIQAPARGDVEVAELYFPPVQFVGDDPRVITESGLVAEVSGEFCADGSCGADDCGGFIVYPSDPSA